MPVFIIQVVSVRHRNSYNQQPGQLSETTAAISVEGGIYVYTLEPKLYNIS